MADRKKPTSNDVARLAGVSQTTVSLILNGSSKTSFSEQTKAQVYNAARELGYRLPAHRGTERRSKHMILLLIPTLSNQFYAELVQTLEQYSDTLGYRMVVCNTFRKKELEKFYIEQMSGEFSGIIYTFLPNYPEETLHLAQRIPVVLIGEKPDSLPICSIELSNRKAGSMIAEHLYALGHRRIVFVSTPTNQLTLARSQRLESLSSRFVELGERDGEEVSIETLVSDAPLECDSAPEAPPYDYVVGKNLTEEFLRKKTDITAFVGVCDMVAFGVISALTERGCRVPEDYSVCGFDNVFTASLITPGLTTIDHRMFARCRSAVDMIVQADGCGNANGGTTLLADRIEYLPKLIVRASTAAPGK